jgi:hypothetical protein
LDNKLIIDSKESGASEVEESPAFGGVLLSVERERPRLPDVRRQTTILQAALGEGGMIAGERRAPDHMQRRLLALNIVQPVHLLLVERIVV